jgi:uncharacterized protein (DUF983 family)
VKPTIIESQLFRANASKGSLSSHLLSKYRSSLEACFEEKEYKEYVQRAHSHVSSPSNTFNPNLKDLPTSLLISLICFIILKTVFAELQTTMNTYFKKLTYVHVIYTLIMRNKFTMIEIIISRISQ